MNSYGSVIFIDDLDAKIKQKENELLMFGFMNTDNIIHNTMKRQLESEIDELKIQRAYHFNYLEDQMMRNCIGGCCGRCQNKQCF